MFPDSLLEETAGRPKVWRASRQELGLVRDLQGGSIIRFRLCPFLQNLSRRFIRHLLQALHSLGPLQSVESLLLRSSRLVGGVHSCELFFEPFRRIKVCDDLCPELDGGDVRQAAVDDGGVLCLFGRVPPPCRVRLLPCSQLAL